MKNLKTLLFAAFFVITLVPACGVKSPPLPPLTEAEERTIEAKRKEREEKEARKQARLKQQKERQQEMQKEQQ